MTFDWIAPATALVAVIVGPAVSLHIANKHFGASVLSQHRQAWINAVRKHVADIVSRTSLIAINSHLGMTNKDDFERLYETARIQIELELLLNPNEDDHKALNQKIGELIKFLQEQSTETPGSKGAAIQSLQSAANDTVKTCQSILKREWIRVKRGK